LFGSLNTGRAEPCSTMSPSSMKITRSATSSAKAISWVTITMVIPSRARSSITASTSPTSSGSRDEVGSSKRITDGSMARARVMAPPRRRAPGGRGGVGAPLASEPPPAEQPIGPLSGHARALALDVDRPRHQVLQHGHVGPQVEALEDHADLRAPAVDRPLGI